MTGHSEGLPVFHFYCADWFIGTWQSYAIWAPDDCLALVWPLWWRTASYAAHFEPVESLPSVGWSAMYFAQAVGLGHRTSSCPDFSRSGIGVAFRDDKNHQQIVLIWCARSSGWTGTEYPSPRIGTQSRTISSPYPANTVDFDQFVSLRNGFVKHVFENCC